MGQFTDILIAEEEETEEIISSESRLDEWDGVDASYISVIDLQNLHELLHEDFEEFQELESSSDGESLVLKCPINLTISLAKASEKKLRRLARRWHATEDFPNHRYDEEDTFELLSELSDLAFSALDQELPLLICLS